MEKFRAELLTMISDLGSEVVNRVDIAISIISNNYIITEDTTKEIIVYDDVNERLLKQYLASLRLEGKSNRTVEQYMYAIKDMYQTINKSITDIKTNDIRFYLATYQSQNKISQISLDNKRRYLSAFFSWLCAEEHIIKNPMLRIKRIKGCKKVKQAFSEEELTKLRDSVTAIRDKALLEFVLSTGCRVSEVSNVDISDLDVDNCECTVIGKGNEERVVYLSEKCMYYLKEYIKSRTDINSALFIGRCDQRLSKDSIEQLMKKWGNTSKVTNVHPHRFRRTMATNAINRGMPIQCLQKILGHKSLNTTMIYCNIDSNKVKLEHKRVS